jgi:nucleoside-diphosphate-sugar epimerase
MILITGSTSFIGKTVVPLLAKNFKKQEILCLCWDKDTETGIQNRKALEKAKLPIQFVDLVTKEGLDKIPKSPDIVIHMAANTDTSTSKHEVNDIGTKNLLDSLKIGPKTHFIYTSTTTFLGGRKDCSVPLNEDSPELPTNEYGRSKLRAEKILIDACNKSKFGLTILRLNTVYGPNPRPKSMFKLLPEQIRKQSLFIRFNWPGLTSIVNVNDVADIIFKLSKSKLPKPGEPEVYILSSESLTMAEISQTMHKAMNVVYKPINLPTFAWKLINIFRPFLPYLEKVLPENLYNPFWRASLIIDHTLWCKTNKINKKFPNWKPILLKNYAKEII